MISRWWNILKIRYQVMIQTGLWVPMSEDGSCLSFSKLTLKNLVLRDVDLSYHSFVDAKLTEVAFVRVQLSGSVFDGARLTGCRFVECRMWRVGFRGAALCGVMFSRCEMLKSHFQNARMSAAEFVACGLTSASFADVELKNCRFSKSDMSQAVLSQVSLSRTVFLEVELMDVKICGTQVPLDDLVSILSGNQKEVFVLRLPTWSVTMTVEGIRVGCQAHTYAEWLGFSAARIQNMAPGAAAYWDRNKGLILATWLDRFGS